MQRNSSNSAITTAVPEFKRQGVIDFDTDKFKPTLESVKIYEELNAISEEIERCRARNSGF